MLLRIVLVALTLGAIPAVADTEMPADGVFVRVIDVGQGHAAVARLPNKEAACGYSYVVYDTGRYPQHTLRGIKSVLGAHKVIDLLVLSHTDADHIGGAKAVLQEYAVTEIIRPGLIRYRADSKTALEGQELELKADCTKSYEEKEIMATWRDAHKAICAEENAGAKVINLSTEELPKELTFGATRLKTVSGYSIPPASWNLGGVFDSDFVNAGSIVIRLEFKNKAILFTGDAHKKTENFMVKQHKGLLRSEVLIAPHHGADDASSEAFIQAVFPLNQGWVVFPAGRGHEHPRKATALRYLQAGVDAARMLRTDRQDNQSDDDDTDKEWDHKVEPQCRDINGDDDIDIVISQNGVVNVDYRQVIHSSCN